MSMHIFPFQAVAIILGTLSALITKITRYLAELPLAMMKPTCHVESYVGRHTQTSTFITNLSTTNLVTVQGWFPKSQ